MTDEPEMSRCHECGELKSDPYEFYDGLVCIVCAEKDMEEDDE